MGKDGTIGAARLKNSGGITIAQDENSSSIFGMPKVAIVNGAVDFVKTPLEIVQSLHALC